MLPFFQILMSEQTYKIQEFFGSDFGKIFPVEQRIMIALFLTPSVLSRQDLSIRTGLKSATISRGCTILKDQGHIDRRGGFNERDRKIYLHSLTQKGRDHCETQIIKYLVSLCEMVT